MSAESLNAGRDRLARRMANAVLARAVRGRRERGGDWGEAVLAEFDQTRGFGETSRWMLGGLRVAWSEHRARVRALPRRKRMVRRAVTVGAFGCLALPLISQFALSAVYVPSGSMQPTIQIGDRYLVDKVTFRIGGVNRDDIVIFITQHPQAGLKPGVSMVKRVVGLPGDTMSCQDGAVLRNGAVIARPSQPADPRSDAAHCTETTVPEGYVYVLGDALDVSVDSRQNGPVAQKDITGRVAARIWPFSR